MEVWFFELEDDFFNEGGAGGVALGPLEEPTMISTVQLNNYGIMGDDQKHWHYLDRFRCHQL